MKKFLSAVLVLVMVMSLAACGQRQGEEDIMNMQEAKTAALIDAVWAAEYENADTSTYYSELENLQNVTEQVQNLSMELFRTGMTEGENGMVSPVSILMAMAMVENGTAGESLNQMEGAFGCDVQSLSSWLRAWSGSLRTSEDTRVNVANSFWFRDSENLHVKDEYLKTVGSQLGAKAYKSAFSQGTVNDMNQWCDENTYGMIKKIVESLSPQDMAVILNATAFEGIWQNPYEEFQIVENEIFYKEDGTEEKASMMHSRESMYIEGSNVTGFSKPYKDGYSFVALLPAEGTSASELISQLDGENWRKLMSSARNEKVNAVIPEFTSAYRVDNLVSTFDSMGIRDIFSPASADLSAMAELEGGQPLFVSGIVHKTFIEVNRKGTRAAAVTGIKVGTTAFKPEKIYDVRLDRPFVYAIVDDVTKVPMFIGTTMSVASEAE
ncbi:MAG: serpin family protein [Firmicutes bacterium]|nr:serpin family protein [Bacillota bacterium]